MLIPEAWHPAVTLTVLALTAFFFIIGKYRTDFVAVCALLILMLTGVLTPQEAFAGFSNTIIITVAGVFIVGGSIVRSGLAASLGDKIMRVAGTNQNVLFLLIMLVTAAVGSLVSNTGTVAIIMPIVTGVAASLKVSPSRFLMPIAFMSSIGGMLTLIGNPGNMIVNDVYVKAGNESMTLFSFLPVGLACLAFGLFILAPATSYFLARRKSDHAQGKSHAENLAELADKYRLAQHMFVLAVPEDSPMIGQELGSLQLTSEFAVTVQEIRRLRRGYGRFGAARFVQISPDARSVIAKDDILYCLGDEEKIHELKDAFGLILKSSNQAESTPDKYRFESIGICELVLMGSSRLIGQTVAESGLREQFGVTLLGIQRGSKYILDHFREEILHPGDALLVQGTWEDLARLDRHSHHWVVVGRPQEHLSASLRTHKIPLTATVLLCMIVAMATGLLPTVVAVLLAAAALIVGRSFRSVEEAYSFVSWETLIMVACMLPMATAMEKTGLITAAANVIIAFGLSHGPYAALIMVYALASGLNIFINSTPIALLLAPAAMQVSIALQVNPLPFLFGVATASCMCFASPFASVSNALVMSAGRYTFFDYVKIGLPLQILMGVFMVFALPLLFSF